MDLSNANQSGSWRVLTVPETGSTNADLLEAAAQGAPNHTVLRAEYQSAGRGRLNRTWEAPAGSNLLVSLLFRDVPAHVHVLTQLVALAARNVAERLGAPAVLKWPNDLLAVNLKLAGVLAQAGGLNAAGVPDYVVVGIGLNLGWAPPEATCLANLVDASHLPSVAEFLHDMLLELDVLLVLDDDAQHAAYRSGLATIGSRVRVEMPDGTVIEGRAVDVERDGRLNVLDECGITHRIDTADVVHLRPATS
jgi:BirA family biotin operon repressor/biotin-[acetyl-CoA-carboxylase] ligase